MEINVNEIKKNNKENVFIPNLKKKTIGKHPKQQQKKTTKRKKSFLHFI